MAHAQMMVFLASANLSVWSVLVTGEFKNHDGNGNGNIAKQKF